MKICQTSVSNVDMRFEKHTIKLSKVSQNNITEIYTLGDVMVSSSNKQIFCKTLNMYRKVG